MRQDEQRLLRQAKDVSDAGQKSQRWPSAIRLKVGDMTGFYAEFQRKFTLRESEQSTTVFKYLTKGLFRHM